MIRPKSPELLQAQAITFGRATGLLKKTGVAWQPEAAYTTHQQEFTEWMRATEARHSWLIEGRELLIANFKRFEHYITARQMLRSSELTPPRHPYFLARGSSATAYKIYVDGKPYVLRTLGGDSYVPNTIDIYALPLLLALGEKGMEQIVACSYEKNICVSEFVPGLSLESLKPADLDNVSTDHIYQALQTIRRVADLGLCVDPIPLHWIFHPDKGFTLIDIDSPLDNETMAGNDPVHFLRYLLQEDVLDGVVSPDLFKSLANLELRAKAACHLAYLQQPLQLNRTLAVVQGIGIKRVLCARGVYSPDIVDNYLNAYMTTLRG